MNTIWCYISPVLVGILGIGVFFGTFLLFCLMILKVQEWVEGLWRWVCYKLAIARRMGAWWDWAEVNIMMPLLVVLLLGTLVYAIGVCVLENVPSSCWYHYSQRNK